MGYNYYRLTAFIPPTSTITFAQIAERIRKYIGAADGVSVSLVENKVSISYEGWSLRVYWEDQSHVIAESQDFANHRLTPEAHRAFIASCNRRITTGADVDPDMDHFNDYVLVINALKSFAEFVIHDDNTNEFLGFPK
jgi:hypothetical protein